MTLDADTNKPTDPTCFGFFFITCLAGVSEVLRSPGCQGVDPNMLGGNLLEIRLNDGRMILSDPLI